MRWHPLFAVIVAVALALPSMACQREAEIIEPEPAPDEASLLETQRLSPGWQVRNDALGYPTAYWADREGRLIYAFTCSHAVPELVVQVMDDGSSEAAAPMQLWIAGDRWTLTSYRPGDDAPYVEGRLPFPDGVRENLWGAGAVRVEAPNRRQDKTEMLTVTDDLKRVAESCRRVIPDRGAQVAPAAPEVERPPFLGRWAREAGQCREFAWTFEPTHLDVPGEVFCRYAPVAGSGPDFRLQGTCSGEAEVIPSTLELRMGAPDALSVRGGLWNEPVELVRCGAD